MIYILLISTKGCVQLTSFDFSILDFIQHYLKSNLADTFFSFITALGNKSIFWIIFTLFLILIPSCRKTGVTAMISLLLEVLCCNIILKPLIARTRPYEINEMIQLLIRQPTDFSFPSGHTAAAFAITSALYFCRSKLWIPSGILAFFIAFSRLYFYVHYPSDVLAGAIIGIFCGWVSFKIINKSKSPFL